MSAWYAVRKAMGVMPQTVASTRMLSRRRWRIRGQVQGVGFRPFVYRLATEYQLHGFVRNDNDGVTIEAQGLPEQLDRFSADLRARRPRLAVIHSAVSRRIAVRTGERGFEIQRSRRDTAVDAEVTVDTAVCDDCLHEMLDTRDRRSGYALINCTNCGPRYSIVQDVPYDRPNTTMSTFQMCEACRSEYTSPADRRFHAQPIACHDCGPHLFLTDRLGRPLLGDPVRSAAKLLDEGRIVAIKGLGGFHLAVRADRTAAVSELRRRKRRTAKPFAVMVRDMETARSLVQLSPAAEQLMRSPVCPIVLAPRLKQTGVCDAVAPNSHRLGLMLPYTPIQHLLFACADPRLGPLVMTSGNASDEPIAIGNDEAVTRLGKLCDAFLMHDRPIERRVDDSVYLDHIGGLLPMRRARGEAPGAIALPVAYDAAEPGLCVGGELKNTIAIVRHGEAILSQHVGDLKHPLAYAMFKRTIDDLLQLFAVRPGWIATDRHPDYLSTTYAQRLASAWDVPLVGVQHHHAHAAALMAEHGSADPMLALVCDGVGYGDGGAIWGGELLWVDLKCYRRLAHIRPLRLPGGDASAYDTRRCALALLHQACGDDFEQHPAVRSLYPRRDEREILCCMIRENVGCVTSTAMGRVFDAAAALLGLCHTNTFEAEAPMRLESVALSWPEPDVEIVPTLYDARGRVIDASMMVDDLLSDRPVAERAARFHTRLARAWADAIAHAHQEHGLDVVGLTGGVFANELLTLELTRRLQQVGLNVWTHRRVPANDGGLALGQAAVALARRQPRKRGKACA